MKKKFEEKLTLKVLIRRLHIIIAVICAFSITGIIMLGFDSTLYIGFIVFIASAIVGVVLERIFTALYWRCPVCGRPLMFSRFGLRVPSYCNACGERIDENSLYRPAEKAYADNK